MGEETGARGFLKCSVASSLVCMDPAFSYTELGIYGIYIYRQPRSILQKIYRGKHDRDKRRNERDAVKADDIGNDIITLREEKQKLLTEGALEQDRIERFEDMKKFLDEQNDFLSEYSDALTRRLIE